MGLGKSEKNGALALIQKAYEAINSEVLQGALKAHALSCGDRLRGKQGEGLSSLRRQYAILFFDH